MSDPGLKDKICLITGGAGAIGFECCKLFAAGGAKVVVAGHSLESAQKRLGELQGQHMAVSCNVAKPEEVDRMADEILKHYGGQAPSVIVTSHGVFAETRSLLTCSEKDWDITMDVNLKGVFLVCKKFLGLMVEQNLKGSIINISSISADGLAHSPEYSASKAGVNGLTKAMAKEFASKGIRVNAVLPGCIGTAMGSNPEVLEKFVTTIPLQRRAEYKEVADLCFFLAGEQSSYITGSLYYINGGLVF